MAILTITRGTAGSDTWYLSCAVASDVRSRKPLQPGVISHRGEKPEGRGRHLQRGVADEAERSKVRRESVGRYGASGKICGRAIVSHWLPSLVKRLRTSRSGVPTEKK
ncbi:hypothetical protein TNCV_3024281 [Trichonephila clavipes]|nr:hypothetical protein TNCV_3024281 [Trichonephila clavipes]